MNRAWLKWLLGCIVILAVALFAYFFGRISVGFEQGGLFGPDLVTDAEVIQRIENAGVTLPKSAQKLAYLRIGFEDPSIWISLEATAPDRAALSAAWLARGDLKSQTIPPAEITDYDPARYSWIKGDISRFDLASWKNPRALHARDPNDQFEYATFEDSASSRIILYSWHE